MLTSNNANYNTNYGILIYSSSNYNTLTGNNASYNTMDGIRIESSADHNVLESSILSSNSQNGTTIINSINITINNSTISNSGWADINLFDSSANLTNTTFGKSPPQTNLTGTSNLTVRWYISFSVSKASQAGTTNCGGGILSGVSVTITSFNGTEAAQSLTTDSTGATSQVAVIEFRNITTKNVTNYASKTFGISGYTPSPSSASITSDSTFTILIATPSGGCTVPSGGSSGGGGGGGGKTEGGTTETPAYSVVAVEIPVIASAAPGETATATLTSAPISQILLDVYTAVSNVRLEVSTLGGMPTTISSPPSSTGVAYKYMTINAGNIKATDIKSAEVTAKVEKSWVSENNIDENKVTVYRYVQDWEPLTTAKASEDETYYYYSATTSGFSVFAVVGEPKVEATPTPNATVVATTEAPTPIVTTPTPTPTKQKSWFPGFEAVFALAALLSVAYMIRRKGLQKH
jgi:PGF-pre-PGF domain-containing protein/PGF-CTERM protein